MIQDQKDKDIVLSIQSGESQQFGLVYDKYVEPIYRFIFFKVSHAEIAEDITSECFLKVYKYITTKRKKVENIRALLYRTARNDVIDYYRKKDKTEISIDDETIGQRTDDDIDIEVEADKQLDKQKLEKALLQLKQDSRDIIILKYIEGYDYKEIADIFEKSEGAIRVAVHRAIKELQKILT